VVRKADYKACKVGDVGTDDGALSVSGFCANWFEVSGLHSAA
jgi:hypothetical protein